MVTFARMGLAKELLLRVGIITSIYVIIGFVVIQRNLFNSDHVIFGVPLLFVIYGVVITISIVYCLRKYRVISIK